MRIGRKNMQMQLPLRDDFVFERIGDFASYKAARKKFRPNGRTILPSDNWHQLHFSASHRDMVCVFDDPHEDEVDTLVPGGVPVGNSVSLPYNILEKWWFFQIGDCTRMAILRGRLSNLHQHEADFPHTWVFSCDTVQGRDYVQAYLVERLGRIVITKIL